jgi:hypothetical protein
MIGTNRLAFTINGAMGNDTYRFSALSSLTDPFGQHLDGDGNGTGGDAYTRTFSLVSPGTYNITINANQLTGANFGNRDALAPKVVSSSFTYQSRQAIQFVFSENVSPSLDASDLILSLNGNPLSIPPSQIHRDYDSQTNTATFTFQAGVILSDGNYAATLNAPGVTDAFGNQLNTGPAESVASFFVLAGDANHDRRVDIMDMYTVAQNFGRTGMTFANGDFNYDGIVDAKDLGILGLRWQQVLA